ncbi:MAG: helix-turn-helix transcriptional regulator [Clostridia bacterium]|nr:helix-turn-helix transcriptional regulator [Clostridia bacterium]
MTEMVPYTHEYLCREFRRLMGCTPTEYLNSLRLDRAHALLENTHMNITDICYDVGFDSVSYFYSLFRSRYSVPPGRYRKLRFISRPDAPTEQTENSYPQVMSP